MHLHSLLEPITRRHPFELIVADYLSLPKGTNGYHTVGLYLDTYSQRIWGFKYKTHGTAKTTIAGLDTITTGWTSPDTFMTDGSSHFKNNDVAAYCKSRGIKHEVIAAYSAWINGLVEGTNKILLGRLKRLCSPGLGEDDYVDVDPQDIPKTWPKFFNQVIEWLNHRILPSLHYSPNELALGLVVNTSKSPTNPTDTPPSIADVERQLSYTEQQCLDGYTFTVEHAHKRKAAFDRRVISAAPGEVIFARHDLVQIYKNALDFTLSTASKLMPQWSAPHRIRNCLLNSYILEDLNGNLLPGKFSSRRLRRFSPRDGTTLARNQASLLEFIANHPSAATDEGPIILASFPNPTPNASTPQNQALTPDDELTNPDDFEAGDNNEDDTDEMPPSESPTPMPSLPLPIAIPTPPLSPPTNTWPSRTRQLPARFRSF
ncbi:hypothetical protein EW146_g9124 [Bondarzewia mesenterica]|uniref:Integrase catalytic domain-containing protein n=1 Tax=Bondarzewia mesenterica TaxID=1095465 RepID=A0A4S4LEB5_9AGAM|nr:hypothetical protein EW146_g9124 [Bondarzewia mesenterica]